ncbi:MAG: hypothetical protein ACK47C_11885 [Paracoccaceae bacterium]
MSASGRTAAVLPMLWQSALPATLVPLRDNDWVALAEMDPGQARTALTRAKQAAAATHEKLRDARV